MRNNSLTNEAEKNAHVVADEVLPLCLLRCRLKGGMLRHSALHWLGMCLTVSTKTT